MFDRNKKIFVGDIDCTKFKEKFKIRSLTRYRKLWNDAKKNGYQFESFEEMENFFKQDIRIKRDLLKNLFYIENKLGAEIVYFLLSEKEYVAKILQNNENKLSFIQINKKNPNDDIQTMNITLGQVYAKAKESINLTPDKLTFSNKINFAKVLKYYSSHIPHKINFDLSFEINDLRKFNTLRNRIVHHDFILLNRENLMSVLNLLKKYITSDYSKEYDLFINKTETFLNNIYGNTI